VLSFHTVLRVAPFSNIRAAVAAPGIGIHSSARAARVKPEALMQGRASGLDSFAGHGLRSAPRSKVSAKPSAFLVQRPARLDRDSPRRSAYTSWIHVQSSPRRPITPHARRDPRAALAASEGVTPASRFARTRLRTKLSRTRLHTAPERSRVHPFAFARLRMVMSERLCWRPIQPRAISQTVFEAWGQALISRARTRARRGANHGCWSSIGQDVS
jgi:hypothetical protein